jgi:enoyl-CoA hydratase/carnithine racemase
MQAMSAWQEGLPMSDLVTVDRRDRAAILTFQRAGSLNAMTTALARSICEALADLDADPQVGGIVLTGAGDRAFCAGVDLDEARRQEPATVEGWFGTICSVYRTILDTRKPMVAAINGIAAGAGFQVALVSDMRLAAPHARLGQPEIEAGIPSIMGAHWMGLHLPWSVNQELSLTGRLMDAEEAAALRLVRIVPGDELVAEAVDQARLLGAKPAVAWARTKARFREVALRGLDEAFRAAVLGQQEAFARGEPQAIMNAFLARRGKS